ncbi:MAG: ribose 5-phosphate isomerase A [Candidatus Diapherotrites archaeon]|nr:ribose 5-phosphate isomerase A [Candidatus Diapherotrites archaeon]
MDGFQKAAKEVVDSIKNGYTIGLGTSEKIEEILKLIRQRILREKLKIKVVPASLWAASIATQHNVPLTKLNDKDLDMVVEFAEEVDHNLNYIKRNTHSLIRDKMLALCAKKVYVIAEKKMNESKRIVPFEVSAFGVTNTLKALSVFGPAHIRMERDKPFVTEGANMIIDVELGKEYDLDDVEYTCKKIPGVLESGVFMNLADKVIWVGEEAKTQEFKTKETKGNIPILKTVV